MTGGGGVEMPQNSTTSFMDDPQEQRKQWANRRELTQKKKVDMVGSIMMSQAGLTTGHWSTLM